MSSDEVFHPEIEVGALWGRWKNRIVRVERNGPNDPDIKPSWFVGPEKNRNQASIFENEHAVYFELEDDGLTEEQRARRNADYLIERNNAKGVTAEMIDASYGVRRDPSETK